MNLIGAIKCLFKGHDLEEESIIPFLNKQNWLKKCKRCGLYVARSEAIGRVTFGEKAAMELKQDMEDFMEQWEWRDNG